MLHHQAAATVDLKIVSEPQLSEKLPPGSSSSCVVRQECHERGGSGFSRPPAGDPFVIMRSLPSPDRTSKAMRFHARWVLDQRISVPF